ncbi:MAG: hypothetical protein MK165_18940 [Pirellulaceae bacterium]|nr:hypothetical protein [Pirellulaceae bacterium]
MRSWIFCIFAWLLLSVSTGCTICQSASDHGFSASGGSWQRDDPFSGRVGSVFEPAGSKVESRPLEAFEGQTGQEYESY